MFAHLKQLLRSQQYIFDWISKVIINYKKLAKENITYIHTKKRQDDLEREWAEARCLRVQIDMEATEDNRKTMPYFVQDHFSTAEALHALSKFNNVGTSVNEDDATILLVDSTKPTASQLPRINLPKFSGVVSQWEGFRNTFKEMVDSNNGIAKMLKFHYLQSLVP